MIEVWELATEYKTESIEFRPRICYLDERTETIAGTLAQIETWTAAREAKSIGRLWPRRGDIPEALPPLYSP